MKKRIIALMPVFAVFIVVFAAMNVSASWSSDISGGKKVAINGNPFTADTFLGVDSLYSTENQTYSSSELVVRFYKEAYGLNVSSGANGPIITSDGYDLKYPRNPAQGDIVYSPSTGRWAIVKNAGRNSLTLFEQDAESEGSALVDRTLKYPSDSYVVLSPRAQTGRAAPTLKNAATGQTVLTANGRYDETTSPATTQEPSSSRAQSSSEPTSGKDKSTSKNESIYKDNDNVAYTTYRSNETSAAPANPVFTTAPMPSGYEEFFTSSADGESAESETQSTDYYDIYSGEQYETREISTAPPPAEEKKQMDPTLIFGIAVIGGIVFITAAGILAGVAIKKRGEDDDD